MSTDLATLRETEAGRVVPLNTGPDMSILAAGRREPPEMPSGVFGNLWPVIKDMAENAGSPPDYVGIGVLAAAASLIGGKRWAKPYETSDWVEPCILWAAVVGDPSSHKSPAIDRAIKPLRSIEQDSVADHLAALDAWKAETSRAKAEYAIWDTAVAEAAKAGTATPPLPTAAVSPDEPTRRRPLVQDATIEAMGLILSGNPQGVLQLRDELAGLLESFDRYNGGGRAFYLEAYVGKPWVIDRVKTGGPPIRIAFAGVSILGGIQPDRLADVLLSGSDDGLAARFLWAWPNKVPPSRPRALPDTAKIEATYRRLEGLQWGMNDKGEPSGVTLPLDAAGADLFAEWQKSQPLDLEEYGSLYRGMAGKLEGTVLRLALVGELLRWAFDGGQEPASVSAESVGFATDYVERYAKPSALRVFGDAALPPVDRNAATLARHILKNMPKTINARLLRRDARLPGLKEAKAVDEACELLVDARWLTPNGERAGDHPGRASKDFTVNPALERVK